MLGHVAIFVFLLIAGTISFYFLEKDWTWYQSLYYCVVTATTVGYGDLEPTTDLSKMVTVVFIIVEFYFGANAIGYFSNMPSDTLTILASLFVDPRLTKPRYSSS